MTRGQTQMKICLWRFSSRILYAETDTRFHTFSAVRLYVSELDADWSTPLKNLDDVMLMREPRSPPRSSSVPPRRSLLPAGSGLRQLPIDPALDDLLSEFPQLELSSSAANPSQKPVRRFYWARQRASAALCWCPATANKQSMPIALWFFSPFLSIHTSGSTYIAITGLFVCWLFFSFVSLIFKFLFSPF